MYKVNTSTGTTCKGVFQLETFFVDVKNMYLVLDSNMGLWNTCKWLLN